MLLSCSRPLSASTGRPIAAIIVCLVAVGTMPALATAQTLPVLPHEFLETTYPRATGGTIVVAAGGDLQGALNLAEPGDTILLQAGATFAGPFTLPVKAGTGWIVVRTAAPDTSLPPPGTRITPAYASVLPKLVTPHSGPAIETAPGAHHYRFTGVEITIADAVTFNYGLVALGDGSGAQNALSQVPYAIVLDRVYVHGRPGSNVRRGVALNSGSTAVIDSYIADIHEEGADSQAIAGWNGPGPFKIVNNYLEAAGENLMFGGADPWIANLVPSDIEIRGNHVDKPLSWRIGDPSYAGRAWSVKNLLELKNARRVLVQGNVFEHNWPHGQNGFAILFTVRNQDGTAPWSVVEDVIFAENVVRHVAGAVNMLGWDDLQPSQQTRRVLIRNNLFEDVDEIRWGGKGRLFQMLSGTADVTVDHNTGLHSGDVITTAGTSHTRFVYRNTLSRHNLYGVGGDATFGNPMLTLTTYFPGATFVRNVLAGGSSNNYPPANFFPPSLADVLFMNLEEGDYRLQSISPYSTAGTDGKDVGANIVSLNTATAGALKGVSGAWTSPYAEPAPADASPPTVSMGSPTSGATVSGTVVVSASASDDTGLAGVQFFVDGTPLGAEDTTSAYEVSWDTTTASAGSHTLTAVARDTAGNTTISTPVTLTVANVTIAMTDGAPVQWTAMVKATAGGSSLQKTAGCNGCQDAGAVSVQRLDAGDGYVEFTVSETTTHRAIGLSRGDADTTQADIDFALRLWANGGVDVRENGTYKRDVAPSYAVGDVFRIAVEGGAVKYYHNGRLAYTSAKAPAYPLLVDVSMLTLNATITNAIVSRGWTAP